MGHFRHIHASSRPTVLHQASPDACIHLVRNHDITSPHTTCRMPLFADTRFLVISEDAANESAPSSSAAAKIGELIAQNGGRAIHTTPSECAGFIEKHKIGHVITETAAFADAVSAAETMVPVTTGKWVWDSVAQAQRRNYRLYAPAPVPFMDKVVVCAADNVPQGDKDAVYTGVRAFGGQYLDALLRYTTHLVALDLTNNKLVVAANIRRRDTADIHIVLPHWFAACLRQQRRVPEEPYLLSNPRVMETGQPDFSAGQEAGAEEVTAGAKVLANKLVFIAGDFHLSEHLRAAVGSLVETLGGSVQDKADPDNIHVYVGKHRHGALFRACLDTPGLDVGSLNWLYYIAAQGRYVRPLESNLLHSPVPVLGVPGLANKRISITGISGDARHYLAGLVAAMGGTFTKTLDCNNDFLVCALRLGDKYDAAHLRWPNVLLVNYLWVEECFVAWLLLDPADPRYNAIGKQTQALGKARLSQGAIEQTLNAERDLLNVSDSIGDSVTEHDGDELPTDAADVHYLEGHSPVQSALHSPPDIARFASFNTAGNTQLSQIARENSETPNVSTPTDTTILVETTGLSSPVASQVRVGRSAKAKASLKLHSDMEDLNEYTSMSKSLRKMKSYMNTLEKTTTPAKKKKAAHELGKLEVEQPQPKKQKTEKDVHLVAILTGCEQLLTLTKSDVGKLSKLGIQIVNEYGPRKHIDTIIAPRVLRTEKFLKSLSKASRILHPSFLSDILSRHSLTGFTWVDLVKEFNMNDYLLDKVMPVKQINEDLGVTGTTSGLQRLVSQDIEPVFKGYSLNLSLNLVGGADLICSILQEHGLSNSKTIKLSAGTRKSGLLSMEDGATILVAHKTKDKKLASKLEGVTVVEWEWCVKSIFHKQAENYEKYVI